MHCSIAPNNARACIAPTREFHCEEATPTKPKKQIHWDSPKRLPHHRKPAYVNGVSSPANLGKA